MATILNEDRFMSKEPIPAPETATAPARRTGPVDPITDLKQHEKYLQELAPPDAPNFSVGLIIDQLQHLMREDKKGMLAKCTLDSVRQSVKVCARLGLCPGYGASAAEIYLIPYNNIMKPQISYIGLQRLAERTGRYSAIQADLLYEGDTFRQWSDNNGPQFEYIKGNAKETLIGAFAVAYQKDGGLPYVVHMTAGEIEYIESKTRKGQNQTPAWKDWYDRMARKTVMLRLCREIPMSSTFEYAKQVELMTIEPEPPKSIAAAIKGE
jgi:phage RecT family recombinase